MLESILEPFRDTSSDPRVSELNSDLRTPAPDASDRVACSIHEAHSIYTVVDSLIYTFLLPSVPRASLSASETRTSTPRCCRTRSANTETRRLRTTQPPFRCYNGKSQCINRYFCNNTSIYTILWQLLHTLSLP